MQGCSAKFCLERVEEDGANAKNTFEEDGIKFIVTRGSPPLLSTLEQALAEIKHAYKEKFGHSVSEEVVEKGVVKSLSLVEYFQQSQLLSRPWTRSSLCMK